VFEESHLKSCCRASESPKTGFNITAGVSSSMKRARPGIDFVIVYRKGISLKLEDYEKAIRALSKSYVFRPKRWTKLNDLPRKLRGPPNNKYGGHRYQHMRPFSGSKFGAASAGRKLTPEERANWEKEWRAREKKAA
jgi:hypothetical protein